MRSRLICFDNPIDYHCDATELHAFAVSIAPTILLPSAGDFLAARDFCAGRARMLVRESSGRITTILAARNLHNLPSSSACFLKTVK